ncbi:type II 3-dehydroquinate dehydratase [Meiothermus sp. CFH 77666]|uniref:type II 3-dehydroquinate dehydratase n=1 Tax=Meiothermus sp. CFH 77666 TaxID=2817942 RepID=UPI001AA0AF59|nr:type II 3-dehydroquinate dehydratase [Meiothermus sp. CFH 77666]MBO1436696.1 type II 3-dehydroquinate dehydratase [Meiothermus sp. CFH 77666]
MILVLNGPNLNLLGKREPEIYGKTTLDELEELCEGWGVELGLGVVCRQSNFEGQLVEWIQQARDEGFRGIVLNPGALTHYSIALLDAIRGQSLPVVEVHLSNIHAREEYRSRSVTAAGARGLVSGFGPMSYKMALVYLADLLEAQP